MMANNKKWDHVKIETLWAVMTALEKWMNREDVLNGFQLMEDAFRAAKIEQGVGEVLDQQRAIWEAERVIKDDTKKE